MPAVMRASAAIERAGVPTVAIGSTHFHELGRTIARVMNVSHIPIVTYPGVPMSDTPEEFDQKVSELVAPAVFEAITAQPAGAEQPTGETNDRAAPKIVTRGSLDDVHDYFLARQWTDGLPMVPPTCDRVEAFLRHTDRDPDEVLGVLLPARQQATIWNVAVNGVMAGCAPEYMPVLTAIIECIADPLFLVDEAGSTPGWEPMVIISGPLAKTLDFNSGTAVARIGRRANSTTGRFLRLFMRNVVGLLPPPGMTDQGAIASNFHIALAENHEFLRGLGWPTYADDHGFSPEDTVVGVQGITGSGSPAYASGDSADEAFWAICRCFRDSMGVWGKAGAAGVGFYPLLVLAPSIAKSLKEFGWTKHDLRMRLWDAMWMPVSDAQRSSYATGGNRNLDLYDRWQRDPSYMAEHVRTEPEPAVRMMLKPEYLQIVIAGNPGRNQLRAYSQQNRQGCPVTRKVRIR
jgi:hypothetical protein